ncbi:Tetratricopeptide repeat-containing protein [Catalinimonas alkaloidigena]|uniref:Tetratricopeptide repeat-containing protein n=1 Tax=Catalinimonas alkaloidigena TaxID=1075417 RepID=A0A1G9S4N0_9BACT|nr:tetratricopeptide repeat protein [Catalinimonas alkaloidigena]SDM30459.1 Tetratricopeptide repeat-containing protein [Catalinimonas alkaloidigena]
MKGGLHHVWICLLTGLLLACQGRTDQAERIRDVPVTDEEKVAARLRAMNDAIARNPDEAEYYFRRADLYRQKGQDDQALTDLQSAVRLDSNEARYHLALAQQYRTQADIRKGMRAARKAESLGMEAPELYFTLGEMYLIVREYQQALDALNQGLRLSPFSPQGYYYKGLVYAESGDTALAISSLQTALEQDVAYAEAYNSISKLLLAREQYRDALLYLNAGTRFTPDDPFLYYNKGVAYKATDQLDSARQNYERALSIDSTLHLAWYNLGAMDLNDRNYAEAASKFEKVVNLQPEEARAHYFLALALRRLGRKEQAATHFSQVLALQKEYVPEATQALKWLRQPAYTPSQPKPAPEAISTTKPEPAKPTTPKLAPVAEKNPSEL